MDDSELHYLTYDPEEMLAEMLLAYMDAGGDVLYAGDEKEMLLRAVLQILAQAFAGIDNALRMDTLRYAVREYLDVYGEKRGCARIAAAPATCTARIAAAATGAAATLAKGTALTADGQTLWLLDEDLELSGEEETVDVALTCAEAGTAGNALAAGTAMQLMTPVTGVTSITCLTGGSGGLNAETDDAYRERIRTYGLTAVTTGPRQQYEAAARAVSSRIIDARALNDGAGKVKVYILPDSTDGLAALLEAVAEALDADDTRPLTDQVSVAAATRKEYELIAECTLEGGGSQAALEAAAAAYTSWQDGTIGRAFNPDRLAALLYQAGASRVVWGSGSAFDGGYAEYTEIPESAYCAGTVTVEVTGA